MTNTVRFLAGAATLACCMQGRSQKLLIEPLANPTISITPINSSSPLPPDVDSSTLPKTLMSLTNTGKKAITCIVLKWTPSQPVIGSQPRLMHLDGYMFPPTRPVVLPGHTLIISQFGSQDKAIFYGAGASQRSDSPLQSHFGELELPGQITAQLDLVVFDDGEIVGADSSHYSDAIVERHNAMIALATQLSTNVTDDQLGNAVHQIIETSGRIPDKGTALTMSLAKTISRSPNRAGTVRSFATHSIPKFYRAQ
jgi:hypothetical protein